MNFNNFNSNIKNNIKDIDSTVINSNDQKSNELFKENKLQINNIFFDNKNDNTKLRSFSNDEYKNKFKTEICKNFQINGYCNFGNNCIFAHGNQELIIKFTDNSKYKTKKCNSFQKGYCSYGKRCQFLHSTETFENILHKFGNKLFYIIELSNKNLMEINLVDLILDNLKLKSRLRLFKKITKN